MEPGETSRSKEEDSNIWAKLVSTNAAYPSIEIRSREVVICSEILSCSDEKQRWCEIKLNPDNGSAKMRNLSSNGIIIDGKLVREEIVDIKNGCEITSGPNKEGYLTYIFDALPSQGNDKKRVEISVDVEHAKCSICLNIWHDVVTVSPCLHNFCNGCFSEWLRRSSTKMNNTKQGVACPQCRAVVHSVGRNHFLHNIEEAIILTFPSLKRTDEEVALLNAGASIKSNIVLGMQNGPSKKRPWRIFNDENNGIELPCFQCSRELGGFRCNTTTTHLRCQQCRVMMPSRSDISVPQKCLGCDKTFCGAYWAAQDIDAWDCNVVCHQETFKPVLERTISRIPDSVHENNHYERDVTERCIQRTGKTLQALISEWIIKFSNKEIDLTNLPINHQEMINSMTYLCNECYNKLINFLLYWFRVTLPSHFLPPDASSRQNCWYGHLCRTQHHNEEHARKLNHVCRPTRGNINM